MNDLGLISLFVGIESYKQPATFFDPICQFCVANNIDALIIKVADGPNDWYSGTSFDTGYNKIKSYGLNILPYAFSYGNAAGSSLETEISIAQKYLSRYGAMCLDIESHWSNQTAWAATLAAAFKDHIGLLYLSCMANPIDHSQEDVMKILAGVFDVVMPQVYTDYLQSQLTSQWANIPVKAWNITYMADESDGSNNLIVNAQSNISTSPAISLWEWQSASNNLNRVNNLVSTIKGNKAILLNSHNEVANFVENVSQFVSGKSAYECVAYCAASCNFMTSPGMTPTAQPLDVQNTAQLWYAREEGSNDASNTNGMSLEAEYLMLQGLGLAYLPITSVNASSKPSDDILAIQAALRQGMPVMICGQETGFYDIGLGDKLPYGWNPTGYHCILATGIAPDGKNLQVRDYANIHTDKFVTGSVRTYDASKMHLISATAIIPSWIEGIKHMINVTDPVVSDYFYLDNNMFHLKTPVGNTIVIGNAILNFYRSFGNADLCGLTFLGLPVSNEISTGKGKGSTYQKFQNAWVVYDPARVYASPIGRNQQGTCYLADTNSVMTSMQEQIIDLTNKLAAASQETSTLDLTPDVIAQLKTFAADLATLNAAVQTLQAEASKAMPVTLSSAPLPQNS